MAARGMTIQSQVADEKVVRRMLQSVDDSLAIDLTAQICRIPSVLGDEGEVGRWLEARMGSLGFDEVVLQEVFPGRFNTIGRMRFGDATGPTFVLTGHMDTKPVCRGWDGDPYSGLVRDDRGYGHGIMDMKSALA